MDHRTQHQDVELLQKIHQDIARDGFCYLDFFHTIEDYERLALRLGTVELRTDVRIDKEGYKLLSQSRVQGCQLGNRPSALLPEGLQLHTDRPTVDILGFYCQAQDTVDGTMFLVDTTGIGDWFSESELGQLENIKINYSVRDRVTQTEEIRRQPVVSKRNDSYHVYYAPWFFPESPPEINRLLSKLTEFVANRETNAKIPINFMAGHSVFLDNHRMLHGRGPISPESKRHLVRLYLVTKNPQEQQESRVIK